MTVSKEELLEMKLSAIGSCYIASTHSQNDSIFLQRAVEIIEEFNDKIVRKLEVLA